MCRRSIITSDDYRKLNTVNGQDLGALYLEVLELPGKGENYMDERRRERSPRFAQVASDFGVLADVLATTIPFGDLGPFQAAAE